MKFYSRLNNAFYAPEIHGFRTMLIADPSWVRPMMTIIDPDWEAPLIEVPDPSWTAPEDDPEAVAPMITVSDPDATAPDIEVPDFDAAAPEIEVANPDCMLPEDAEPISDEEHAALMAEQATGKAIAPGIDGKPVAVDHVYTLAQLKAARLNELNKQCQAIADQYTAGYPTFEKETWRTQEAEAMAWSANNAAPTPNISVMAGLRGIPTPLYLQRTLDKVNAFRAMGNFLVGKRQRYADQIEAAANAEALAAIAFDFTPPQ